LEFPTPRDKMKPEDRHGCPSRDLIRAWIQRILRLPPGGSRLPGSRIGTGGADLRSHAIPMAATESEALGSDGPASSGRVSGAVPPRRFRGIIRLWSERMFLPLRRTLSRIAMPWMRTWSQSGGRLDQRSARGKRDSPRPESASSSWHDGMPTHDSWCSIRPRRELGRPGPAFPALIHDRSRASLPGWRRPG
jgi:hypothetical protein